MADLLMSWKLYLKKKIVILIIYLNTNAKLSNFY